MCLECPLTFEEAIDVCVHVFRKHSHNLGSKRVVYICKATKIQFWGYRDMVQHVLDIMAYHFQVPEGFEKFSRKAKVKKIKNN